jgi:hypothetical protein
MRESGGAVQAATGVTVGGAAATFLSGSTNANNVIRAELWYKLAPATGTVAITTTGHASTDAMVVGTLSFKAVAQTSTFNTAKNAEGSSDANADANTIASAAGEMGVDCLAARYGAASAVTLSADGTAPVSTERYDNAHDAGGGTLTGGGYTEDGAATSIDMRVDLSESVQWAAVAVSMRPLTVTRRPIAPIILSYLWSFFTPYEVHACYGC